ncbi:MAG: nitric-oxide reductase large subunit [Nevskiaceae bacterium]|jgi:nitric oxide reductase subunit B|nr:nitric-oxide reductase large subunit [Nevskiaceae bacterium]
MDSTDNFPNTTRRLWWGLATLLICAFAVLLWVGYQIYQQAPPIPQQVVTASGRVVYTQEDMEEGRRVWQRMGGMQVGSIWGHGALVAPDWSADWMHREGVALLAQLAREQRGVALAQLDQATLAQLQASVRLAQRQNTYDASTGTLRISDARGAAIDELIGHYDRLFGADPTYDKLRETFALRTNTVDTSQHRRQMTAFFFWSAWAAVTERPGRAYTYTSNWPYEPALGNTPTPGTLIWSVFSVVFLLAGVGLLAWHYFGWVAKEAPVQPPASDPLHNLALTPSMRATRKYFWIVVALFLVQILLGAITAHYQVDKGMYGVDLTAVLPYSLTRSWHTQLAVLWIATAWLGTGLYIAPAISGVEPRWQRLGVNLLFVCLLIIVVGAFAGQWLAVTQKLALENNFLFGHQGWEYTDIGRFWQAFLFIGLLLWLTLVGRALWPALRRGDEISPIVTLLFLSTCAIGLLYGAGLMWGEHSQLSVVEYWRWWVVHLWVEGFFEVFAVAVISFLFVKLGLVRARSATINVLFATIVFLAGGVLGTFHHLYWSGTPIGVLALGASFSALEVVPLALVAMEARETLAHGHAAPWMQRYRGPIRFFLAVSFWNLVGAGLLGFLINTPIALYFMQGLNLTPTHGHAALFGVYGMLGLGLMLFCLRGLRPQGHWHEGMLRAAFWALNGGLALMVLLTLLPLGIAQLHAALEHGYWYARSAQFLDQPLVHTLVWLRMPGDVLFAGGALLVAAFVAQLWRGGRG